MFSEGRFSELMEEATSFEAALRESRQSKRTVKRMECAVRYACKGRYGSALKLIDSDAEVVELDQQKFDALLTLHPPRTHPSLPPTHVAFSPSAASPLPSPASSSSSAPVSSLPRNPLHNVSPIDINRLLHHLPTGRAADVLGWRYEHLASLISSSCFPDFCSFVIPFLSSPILPSSFRPFWTGAALLGLSKPTPPFVRPIAISLSLRRFMSRCVVSTCASSFTSYFVPHQLAISFKGGTEAIAHLTRAILERSDDEVAWQNDSRNAFNCVSRDVIYRELVLH
jgi:hypothetical protein